jgi:hypothetical protein
VITIVHLYTETDIKITHKFREELIAYFLLKRHGPITKRRIQQFLYGCVCIRCRGNVFNLVIQIIFGEKYNLWSSSLCSFLQPPNISSLYVPNILPTTLFSNTFSLYLPLNIKNQVSHLYLTTGKIVVLCILIFTFLDSSREDKSSEQNGGKHYPNSICS